MNHIIGLAGQKVSGKTTAYEYIKSIITIPVVEHSFAKPLKDFCIDVLGLSKQQCNGTDEEKNSLTDFLWEDVSTRFREKYTTISDCLLRSGPMTGREVMQVQGEMQRTFFCDEIWIKPVFRNISKCKERCLHVIVDIRHKNEAYKCYENGAHIIVFSKKTNTDKADSEKELLSIDWKKYGAFVIDNTNMTIDEKNEEIKKILKKIKIIE